MPITLPNLDDRRYEDLLQEALARIPVHASEWINHNSSDPGITLVELFAYLTEMLIYRLNRVTDANVCKFLKLIDGVERTPSVQQKGMVTKKKDGSQVVVALSDEVRDVVLNLRRQDRAVTREDYERLALDADPQVKRAYCVPQRDLTKNTLAERNAEADAHVRVIIVPSELSLDGVSLFSGKRDDPLLQKDDLIDPTSLHDQLKKGKEPLSQYLNAKLDESFLRKYGQSRNSFIIGLVTVSSGLTDWLISNLNEILKGPSLYDDSSRFAGVKLRPE